MKRLLTAGVCCSAIAAIVAAGLVAPAPAATSGLAFDSVSRLGGNGADTAEPGTFEADFEQASKPREASHIKGPFAGMMNAAMDRAGAPMAMMQSGIAERHYYAGALERTDDIAGRTATITDCAARTITTLNLAKKTYRVVSMDQPTTYAPSSSGPAQPRATPTDDGTRVSMVVKTTSLGPKKIGPDPTNGYNLDLKMTSTKRNGESETNEMSMTSYYSNYPSQGLVCSHSGGAAAPGPAGNFASIAGTVSRALTAGGQDSRFKVSSSGPPIPSGKLSLFDRMVPKAQGGAGASGGFGMLTERGHVRGITDADPAFSVPPDFTKER